MELEAVGEVELVFNEATGDVDVLQNELANHRLRLHQMCRPLISHHLLIHPHIVQMELMRVDLALNDVDGRRPLTADDLIVVASGIDELLENA